jgi:hypothetical protein
LRLANNRARNKGENMYKTLRRIGVVIAV